MTTMVVWRGGYPRVRVGGWGMARSGALPAAPEMNAQEDAEGYTIELALPGLKAEAFELTLEGQLLRISAEYPEAREGVRYHLRERAGGKFDRAVRFRSPVSPEGVTASYEQGILTVRVPKSEAARPRRIAVQAPALIEAQPAAEAAPQA